jgi:hypothetical protein
MAFLATFRHSYFEATLAKVATPDMRALFLDLCQIAPIQPLDDFRSYPLAVKLGGSGSVMGLDAGKVLKRSVLCPHCDEDYLFTLMPRLRR